MVDSEINKEKKEGPVIQLDKASIGCVRTRPKRELVRCHLRPSKKTKRKDLPSEEFLLVFCVALLRGNTFKKA